MAQIDKYAGKLIIGYKKCIGTKWGYFTTDGVLVTLAIPADAVRMQPKFEAIGTFLNTGGKCRADRAIVLDMEWLPSRGNRPLPPSKAEIAKRAKPPTIAYSDFDRSFVYKVGRTVRPKEKYQTEAVACGSGIHFFLTKAKARTY